ncbi:unnamed protein product [marine sediment metagenome]|uniref:Uncharacterized protein n=1 Tax=marine sediment metagenome TaxID=412755 RepID=X1S6F4_9ZZZZ
MYKRFKNLKDLFTIACKKCSSEDVDLTADTCPECGITIKAECNKCGQCYDYHKFEKIEVN